MGTLPPAPPTPHRALAAQQDPHRHNGPDRAGAVRAPPARRRATRRREHDPAEHGPLRPRTIWPATCSAGRSRPASSRSSSAPPKAPPPQRLADRLAQAPEPRPGRTRAHPRLGGGAFLGYRPGGNWVTADPEHAVIVLGPPRSGKTSSVVIPAMLAAPGAAVSTATKPDVMEATWRSRAQLGQMWLFDPTGEQPDLPAGHPPPLLVTHHSSSHAGMTHC